jgi:excisionase family DNA binding protein
MTSRIQPPSDGDRDAAVFEHPRGRRHREEQIKFFTIAEVAEHLHVSSRTVRRWVTADELVVHRVGNVVRVSEGDLRAFLAPHRGG